MTGRSEAAPLRGESARLHPAAVGVWIGEGAVSIIFLVLVAGMVPVVGGAVLAALLLGVVVRYLRFRWRLEPDAVIIEEGLLVRKRRIIRRDRIQTVDLERGIVHRILGVAEVRIEAIGGGGTEGTLVAVSPQVADSLRRVLLSREGESKEGEPRPEPPESVLAQVTPEDLVLAGVTGGRVGVMAALVGFLLQAAPETWWTETVGRVLQQVPDPTSVVGFRVLAVLILFALLTAFFLSVVATVFAHWDFTLSATDETLEVRRGLFTQHTDTVPFRRLQAVRVEENLPRRLLRRGALRVVVAGRAGTQSRPGTDVLLPIGSRDQLHRLARRVVGLEGDGVPALDPMPARARRRRFVRACLAAAAIAALAGILIPLRWEPGFWSVAGWTLPASLVLLLPMAEGAYRGLGRADLGSHLIVREGILNRRTTYLPADRLQLLETTANPFQRVARLATVHLQVARPAMAAAPRALDLDAADARDWRERLVTRVSGVAVDGGTGD